MSTINLTYGLKSKMVRLAISVPMALALLVAPVSPEGLIGTVIIASTLLALGPLTILTLRL